MAFQGSQSSSTSPLCLPLLKFSFATTSGDGKGPIPWVHISSKSLVALFETIRDEGKDGAVEERQTFKVLQDPDVMEEIDLGALSIEAHRTLARGQDSQSHDQSTAVNVVVSVPLIAIRYPFPGGQIRRFQVKFAENEYFYDAMKILSRANIPTQESRPASPHRPQNGSSTVPAHQIASSNSVSQLGSRPVSASSYDGSSSQTISTQCNTEMTPICGRRPSTSSSGLMPPPLLSSSSSHKIEHQSTKYAAPVEMIPSSLHKFRPIGVKNATASLGSFHSAAGYPEMQNRMSVAPSSQEAHRAAESLSLTIGRPIHNVVGNALQRPLTAPSTTDQRVSSLLPPKRELPFKPAKARARSLSTGNTDDVRQIASEEAKKRMVPSTASQLAVGDTDDAETGSQASKNTTKRKLDPKKKTSGSTVAKKPRISITRKKPSTKQSKESTPVPSVEDILKSAEALEQAKLSKAETLKGLRVCRSQEHDMKSQQLPEVMEVSNISPKPAPTPTSPGEVPKNMSLTTALHQPTTEPQKDSSQSTTISIPCKPADQILVQETQQSRIEASQQLKPNNSNPSQQDNSVTTRSPSKIDLRLLLADPSFANYKTRIKSWTDLPEDQRTAMLETWICAQYQDPAFLTLCETIEGVWQSILVCPGQH